VLLGWFATRQGIPLIVAAPLVVLTTTLIGYLGGYIRAQFNVPSFVTSLALWSIYDSLKQVLSNNQPIPVASDTFRIWAGGKLLGIPYPIIIAAGLFLLFRYISTQTVYGRSIYAVGGNAKAAYASGINVKQIRASVFAITGGLAVILWLWPPSGGTPVMQLSRPLDWKASS
jgi:simple sugar transport system permease protein